MDRADFQSIFPIERCEITNRHFADKEQLFQYILDQNTKTSIFSQSNGQIKEKIYQGLIAREMVISTGVGKGLAIPHCSLDFLHDTYGYLLRLKKEMEFQAIDKKKVFFVCTLFVPTRGYAREMRILSDICTLFSRDHFRQQIKEATTAPEIHDLLLSEFPTKRRKKSRSSSPASLKKTAAT